MIPISLFDLIFLAGTLHLISSASSPHSQNQDRSTSINPDLLEIVNYANQFGMRLFNETAMSPENQKNDVIFSSPSIFILLSMLYKTSEGETRNEIGRALFAGHENRNVHKQIKVMLTRMELLGQKKNITLLTDTLALFNDVLYMSEIFVKMAKLYFDASIHRFANYDQLKMKIEEINQNLTQNPALPRDRAEFFKIDLPDSNVAGLLYNRIYFKVPWISVFDSAMTSPEEFLVEGDSSDRKCVMVPTMKMNKAKFMYFEDPSVQILSVPFYNGDLAFYVVMPSQRTTDLGGMHRFLESNSWYKVSRMVHQAEDDLNVQLPKFDIEADYDLQDVLNKLGIRMTFTDGARFPLIGNVTVSKAIHKAFLKIDESGGEAGAKTQIFALRLMKISPPKKFFVDRPFVFAIVDQNTGLALFQGAFRGQQFRQRHNC